MNLGFRRWNFASKYGKIFLLMQVKIVDINRGNFDSIPRPANQSFNCQECFFWVGKKDGRTDLVRQKRNWLYRRGQRYGSLAKLLLWGKREKPVGFIQFGPIAEFKTAELLYQNGASVPRRGWCVSCISIQSPYRGRGLATRMVRNVLRDMKGRGVKTVDAYPIKKVKSWNQVSVGPVALWAKCGFEKVAKAVGKKSEPIPENGYEVIIMRKKW